MTFDELADEVMKLCDAAATVALDMEADKHFDEPELSEVRLFVLADDLKCRLRRLKHSQPGGLVDLIAEVYCDQEK